MGSCQTKEVIAAGEEKAESAFISGLLEGRYGNAKCGCERVAELGDEGIEGREAGANPREGRSEFPDGDLDVIEAGLGEDAHFDVVGNPLRILKLDSL